MYGGSGFGDGIGVQVGDQWWVGYGVYYSGQGRLEWKKDLFSICFVFLVRIVIFIMVQLRLGLDGVYFVFK